MRLQYDVILFEKPQVAGNIFDHFVLGVEVKGIELRVKALQADKILVASEQLLVFLFPLNVQVY